MTVSQPKPSHWQRIRCVLLCCLLLSGCAAATPRRDDGLHDLGCLTAHMPDNADRAIRALTPWEGRLYVAYGDPQQRNGPLPALHLDLASQRVVLEKDGLLNQHSIEIWRQFDGALLTPGIAPCVPQLTLSQRLRDRFRPTPSATPPGHIYVRRTAQSAWQQLALPDTLSVQDVASYEGAWYAAGTSVAEADDPNDPRRAYAAIYRSWDQGISWELAYAEKTLLQFTTLHVYRQKLYATVGPIARVYNGQRWTAVQLLPENSDLVRKQTPFQHLLVLIPDLSWRGPSPVFLFDGQETHAINLSGAVRDGVAVDDWLYVLTTYPSGQAMLWETNDTRCRCPASFARMGVYDLDAPATALAYADGHFYIGTQDGHLYRLAAWR